MNTDYIVTDIGDVPPDFLAEDLEDGRMYRAYKASNLEGFECSCLAVTGPNGRQLVVPYFVMDFQLNTMLD